ncbi:zinc finger protein 37 homolog [Cheilinus undulatus]|uniref:zinc finger protein 37 homolog n=1 Tax=Cheilinus undulatus TaxID=241271 RepID=UPI001BD3604A|nr:zinc finger protein 37 homolog [Cheilinus undulatus]
MCSVVGCYSGRLGAQRFKLPEDPERRLQWVRFLAAANKQRFKESSWTDISVCIEHFKDDCFEKRLSDMAQLTLKPTAVPSLFNESEEPEAHLESPKHGESSETVEPAGQSDLVELCNSSVSSSEESVVSPAACQESPAPKRIASSDKPHAITSVRGQTQAKNVNTHLLKEKAARLHMKGKYVVNEKRLFQLFNPKCPSCGSKLKMQKITYGLLFILNQQCLQCDYKNQWKSQVNANIPTDEELCQTGHKDVSSENKPDKPTDGTQSSMADVSDIVASIAEESFHMEETDESCDQDDMDSDEDWKPDGVSVPAQQKTREEEETEEEGEDDEGDEDYPPVAHKDSELCTDCGKFFNKSRHHICEHKTKPYSCNICGKRFESDHALSRHSRIHDANYEHRCKYCHVTFKTKADKLSHEQTHMTEGKPYKCPDCPQSFSSNKERKVHIEEHRGPPQLKCDFCGIEFCWPLALRRHLAVHTGEKPYKCSVCDRGFNQASHLKSHMRLHTGERPFKCQHCDKCFNHNVSLKSHIQRYHTSISGDELNYGNKSETLSSDSGIGNVEVKQERDEGVVEEFICKPKWKKRGTGRPLGRPRSEETPTKTSKQRGQRSKRTQCHEESGDEQSYCDMPWDVAGLIKKANSGKSPAKRRGRPRKNPEPFS